MYRTCKPLLVLIKSNGFSVFAESKQRLDPPNHWEDVTMKFASKVLVKERAGKSNGNLRFQTSKIYIFS